MRRKNKEIRKIEFGKFFRIFVITLLIILIFTFIDAFIHSLKKEYSVPDYYFKNKIIFGTLYGFFSLLIIEKKNLWKKAFIFSVVVSILLQIRYFLEGYPIDFVFGFLIIHFIILVLTSFIVLKLVSPKQL